MSNQSVQIRLRNEELLTLTQAARAIPAINGKRPHTSTLWRWCRKGINGVKLEYIRIGRRIVTSDAALERFTRNLAAGDAGISSGADSQAPVNVKSHLSARDELMQGGFNISEDGQ